MPVLLCSELPRDTLAILEGRGKGQTFLKDVWARCEPVASTGLEYFASSARVLSLSLSLSQALGILDCTGP